MKKFVEKMKRFWSLDAKANGGFTLVELIVVIAILAILAGIAVPAYSGYVEKAKKAEDEQLLAAVNTAFAAACIEGNVDISTLSASEAGINIKADGTVDAASVKPAKLADEFAAYYAGNETTAFAVIEYLKFDSDKDMFVEYGELSGVYDSLLANLDQDAIDTLLASGFITYEGLLNKVDDVTEFAAVFDSGVYDQLFEDEGYMRSMCKALGVANADTLTGTALSDAYQAAIMTTQFSKMASMAGMSFDEFLVLSESEDPEDIETYMNYLNLYADDALNQVQANAAVLYAAQSANNDSEAILTLLSGGNAKQDIIDSLNESYGVGLSNAAAAYGLYTAYAYSTGDAELIASTNDPVAILNGLEDPAFQAYLNNTDGKGQAQKDLDGYLAAMNMITSSSGDNSEAVSNLLINGFGDPELIAMLEKATEK